MQFQSDKEAVDSLVKVYGELSNEIGKVIVGQEEIIKNVLISVFSLPSVF